MSKSVTKGAVILIVAGLICKILGAFFRLPLTNIIGVEGIGAFQMIMSLYAFALILSSGGMTVTLSKLVSDARAKGDEEKINSVYKISLLLSVFIGFFLGIIFFIFANHISLLQGSQLAGPSYKLMAVLLPLGGIVACIRGVIQGNENMVPTAISQVIEQAIRFVFGLLFASILIKFGVGMGVFGAILGIVLGEIFSLLYLLICKKKLKVKAKGKKIEGYFSTLVPVVLGAGIMPFVGAVDSLVIVSRLAVAGIDKSSALTLFGLQTGVVGTFLNLPLIISSSIGIALLPSLSFLKSQSVDTSEKTSNAFKVLWFLLLPLTIGIVAVARPLYQVFYPSLTPELLEIAVNLTKLGGVSTVLTAIMQFLVAVVQAKGSFVFVMVLQLVAGCLKILSVITLCALPQINIYGLILGNIFLSSVVAIGCLIKLKNEVSVPLFDIAIPLLSSVIMYFLVETSVSKPNYSAVVLLALGVVLGIFVYFLLTFPCLFSIARKFLGQRKKKQV